ncbi:HNH endonuclease [Streptomyces mobaraensis]|nr:HNH endonuclease signature motif containing protein [Streptomyces mobaraensis]
MAEGRPDIPTALKRAVLVEAGHRCAIPTCRQVPVEIAHITAWSQVKQHAFDNLIALCPTCHTRYDKGDIDRKSVIQYKENLSVLNGRYTDVERQLLKVYAKKWAAVEREAKAGGKSVLRSLVETLKGSVGFGEIAVRDGMQWMLSNLVDDGVILVADLVPPGVDPTLRPVGLTPKGLRLIDRMVRAEPL